MMPNLILDNYFPLDENYAYGEIQKVYLGDNSCGRIGGIRYKKTGNGKEIVAWQCNLAKVQNFNAKLPTIVHINVDCENKIQAISLNSRFKGSQGIPCSYRYLNRRLQNTLLGVSFVPQEPLIREPSILACRHTYELVFGACTFVAHCESKGISDAFLSEATMARADVASDIIEITDRISLNGNEVLTKLNISNCQDAINYSHLGAIEVCNGLKVSGYGFAHGVYNPIGLEKGIDASDSNEFKIKMMKVILKSWLDSGERLGVKRDFHFSQIWPPSLFGIMSQAFAIFKFGNNYLYFQHSLSGLQRMDDTPLCLGVIKDIEEGKKYFEGFSEDDLY